MWFRGKLEPTATFHLHNMDGYICHSIEYLLPLHHNDITPCTGQHDSLDQHRSQSYILQSIPHSLQDIDPVQKNMHNVSGCGFTYFQFIGIVVQLLLQHHCTEGEWSANNFP